MANNAMTPEPGGPKCCCGCGSGSPSNAPLIPWESSKLGGTGSKTCFFSKLDSAYFTYSSDVTCCDECTRVPVKTSSLSLGWNRVGGQEAAYFCYPDGWKPAGAGGVFSFLPEVNLYNIPGSGRRVNSDAGTVAFDSSNVPQAELAISARLDPTYFTTCDMDSGAYFEYWAGSSLTTSDARYGRPNRRYDPAGNSLFFNYSNDGQGRGLLRSLSGNLGGNVIPYFYYADETVDATHFAPISKVYVLDLANAANSRTTYYDYTSYTDTVTYFSWPYLSRITNPTGCVQQFDPIVPFNDISDVFQLKRDIDAEGYQTYFSYTAGKLSKVTEPEGRITYYDYLTGESHRTDLGRSPAFTLYDTGAGSGKMTLVIRESDPLGNTTYFTYDATLARITKRINPLGNFTYFDYLGGSLDNKYAPFRQVSAFTNAVTYFGYNPGTYDLVKDVGPRHTSSFSQATYYEYDGFRSRTAMMDALGYRTLYGRDSFRHIAREQDALGNTVYFNYSTLTGNLDSQSDQEGDATYFGYNSFRDLTVQVSPRWPENSFQAFATYFEYDLLGRKKKSIDALQNVTYFDWTSRSLLSAQVDARGTDRAYTYNGLRLLTRETVTDLAGSTLQDTKHGYDIYKNRTQTLDGLGNASYFFYDQIDRLIAQTDALKQTSYFQYDRVGNRTAVRDARNNSAYFFYDLLSRQTAVKDGLGNQSYFGYDLSNNRTTSLDPRNNATYFGYDQLDRLQALKDALGNATYFYFDAVGNRFATKDARFNTAYFFYDRANRLTSTKDALGGLSYFTYDRSGNQTQVVDARGGTSSSAYDALDRVVRASDPVGNAVKFQYDQVGNRTAIDRGIIGYGSQPYGTSPYGQGTDGVTTYFFYDGLNRNTSIRDPLANYTYFFYDLDSNRTAVRNPLLHTTYFGYDALNRLVRVQDPLVKTTYFEFDAVGNQTKIIDPDNHALLTRYDDVNRPDALLFADGGSAYFFYDEASNRTRDLDPRLTTTYYGYDALSRAVRMQDALGRTIYFEYDGNSNLSKEIGAEQESASYTYDALNRRTNIAYSAAGSIVAGSLSASPYFVYDPTSNLTQMGDLSGLHRMGFDQANRLTRHQYPNANVVYFEYDSRWNTSAVVYPGSSGRQASTYDSIDRETNLKAPSGAYAYFTYDRASNRTQRFLGNSAKTDITYDSAERVATWRASNKNSNPLTYFDYTRDAKGLITKVVREATHTIYYAYDANDRLTTELWAKSGNSEVYGYRYAYDLAGNRTKMRANGSDTYYYYDQANQLTVRGTNALFATPTYYTWDRNGSLTDLLEPSGTTKFAYNAAGLTAKIRWRDASSTYFFYDGLLRRYAMIANGTPTYFLWEGMNLLQEQNADGSVKEEHTNSKTPIAGIAQLVETNRPGATPQKIYPIMDMRGTITKWIQSDGSTVQASREYDAFGNIIPNSSTGTWPGRFGYQGQAWFEILSADGAQRLLQSPTRVFDPSIGRFLQNEPILSIRPRTHYLYCGQSPLPLVDPLGLQGVDPGAVRHGVESCNEKDECPTLRRKINEWIAAIEQRIFQSNNDALLRNLKYFDPQGFNNHIDEIGHAMANLSNCVFLYAIHKNPPCCYDDFPRIPEYKRSDYPEKVPVPAAAPGPGTAPAPAPSPAPAPASPAGVPFPPIGIPFPPVGPPVPPFGIPFPPPVAPAPRPPAAAPAPPAAPPAAVPPPATAPFIDPQTVANTIYTVGGAYLLYRAIRFLPSLAPPLWWTIPANVFAP